MSWRHCSRLRLVAGLSLVITACAAGAGSSAQPGPVATLPLRPAPAVRSGLHRPVRLLSVSLVQEVSQPDDSVRTAQTTLYPQGMALVLKAEQGSGEVRYQLRDRRALACLMNRAVTLDNIARARAAPQPKRDRERALQGAAPPRTVLHFDGETRTVPDDLLGLAWFGLDFLGIIRTNAPLPTKPETAWVLTDPAMRGFFFIEPSAERAAKLGAQEVESLVEVLASGTHGLCHQDSGLFELLAATFAKIPDAHFDRLKPLLGVPEAKYELIRAVPSRRAASASWVEQLTRSAVTTRSRMAVALALDKMEPRVAGAALSQLVQRLGRPEDLHQALLFADTLAALKTAEARTVQRGELHRRAARLLSSGPIDAGIAWGGALARSQRSGGASPDLGALVEARALRALGDSRWQVRVAAITALDALYSGSSLPPGVRVRVERSRADSDPCVSTYAQALLTTRSYPGGAGNQDCQVSPLTGDYAD